MEIWGLTLYDGLFTRRRWLHLTSDCHLDVQEMIIKHKLYYLGNGVNEYKTRASLPKLRVEQGWQNISADFTTTSGKTKRI